MNARSKGIALSYIYTVMNTVIGLFMSAYIIRIIGQTEYGIYQSMTAFASYLGLVECGTATIMARNVSMCKIEHNENDKLIRNISTIWTTAIVQSILMLVVAIVFYFSIGIIYQTSMTISQIEYSKILFTFVIVKIITSFCTQALNGILLGFEHYSVSTLVSIVYLTVRTGVLIVLLIYKPYAIVLVIIDAILAVFMLLYTVLYCKIQFNVSLSFKYFDAKVFREVLPLAMAMFLQVIINMANNNVDKFVIGILMSPEAVAVYSIGMYIYTTFSSLTVIPVGMYMPKIAQDIGEGKANDELMCALIQPCRLVFLIGGLILFGFGSIGKQFITIVYGKDYLEAWIIAIIVMVPMLIHMSNAVLENVLTILNKRLFLSICLLLTTMANIILTIWWIQTRGIVGAAAATAICTLLGQVILMNMYYERVIHIRISRLFISIFKGILPSLISALIFSVIMTYFIHNIYLSFVVGGIVFMSVFAICMMLFGANEYEKELIKNIIKRKKLRV